MSDPVHPTEVGMICEPDEERFMRLWRALGIVLYDSYRTRTDWNKQFRIIAELKEFK